MSFGPREIVTEANLVITSPVAGDAYWDLVGYVGRRAATDNCAVFPGYSTSAVDAKLEIGSFVIARLGLLND